MPRGFTSKSSSMANYPSAQSTYFSPAGSRKPGLSAARDSRTSTAFPQPLSQARSRCGGPDPIGCISASTSHGQTSLPFALMSPPSELNHILSNSETCDGIELLLAPVDTDGQAFQGLVHSTWDERRRYIVPESSSTSVSPRPPGGSDSGRYDHSVVFCSRPAARSSFGSEAGS